MYTDSNAQSTPDRKLTAGTQPPASCGGHHNSTKALQVQVQAGYGVSTVGTTAPYNSSPPAALLWQDFQAVPAGLHMPL
jgi:hypothetical protein